MAGFTNNLTEAVEIHVNGTLEDIISPGYTADITIDDDDVIEIKPVEDIEGE